MNNDMKSFIDQIKSMPAMPNIIVKALNVIKDDRSGVNDLVQLISCDQALTTQVLKIVNSAYYGFAQQITSMSKALPLLGMAQIKNLILAVAMKSMITTKGGKDLWKHSIKTAVACEVLAGKLQLMDSGDAFVIGFLHDIGKMIINLKNNKTYTKVQELTAKGINIIEAEKFLLGCDHSDVGALLAKKWELPVVLINCVKYHHAPQNSSMKNVSYFVYAADRLVQDNVGSDILDPAIWNSSPIDIGDPQEMRDLVLSKAESLIVEL